MNIDEKKAMSQKKFLMKLQLEYLTQKLRSQVYRESKFVKVARDIAEKKRIKIQGLSKEFGCPCIFDEGADYMEFVRKYFWKDNGLPNMQYKDKEQKRVQGNYDKWYLLYRGTLVLYNGVEAKVLLNDPPKNKVKIETKNEVKTVKYSDISLIENYKWI